MKLRIDYNRAATAAAELLQFLKSVCESIVVAGSIRRREDFCGDIEIVCIPKRDEDLAGSKVISALEPLTDLMIMASRKYDPNFKTLDGPKQKKFLMKLDSGISVQVDLFIADQDNLGLILALRTGPAEFSHKIVTDRQHGGFLPSHLSISGGYLLDSNGTMIPVRTEKEFFELLGMDCIDPALRNQYFEYPGRCDYGHATKSKR